MSAERHAMEAALEYSKQLEKRIAALEDEIREQRMRNSDLRGKVSRVKDAVGDRDRPENMCEASMPMERNVASTREGAGVFTDCPRCKNCGAPV